eukprot:TRINITY_DN5213_c0_g1_i1.p1 TRINITY_DN5213_c0_g1~~TRINITY_DN5213_c0_g1_i1.p1  ORF type:complete len:311 (-),score=37.97 TRINITY_DN5213_c0_g1_i1:267-1199(-)
MRSRSLRCVLLLRSVRGYRTSSLARQSWLFGKKPEENKEENIFEADEIVEEKEEMNITQHERWSPQIRVPISSFTQPSQKVGEINLNPDIFLAPIREDIMHRVIMWQRSAIRQGTAKQKNRGEVSGGGKKPWAQKGTGRARHGSIRSPLWKGGGKAHPKVPRSHYYPLQNNVRAQGVCSALSLKLAQGNIRIVRDLTVRSHKTKLFKEALSNMQLTDSRVLFIYDDRSEMNSFFEKAHKNIPTMKAFDNALILNNVFDILKHDVVLLTVGGLGALDRKLAGNVPNIYNGYTPNLEIEPEVLGLQQDVISL